MLLLEDSGGVPLDLGDPLRHYTNIVAYLPFLTLPGSMGEFLYYSLPIVLTCSLVAALIVAMTFIPFLGYFLLKPKLEPPLAERRKEGFPAFYYRVGEWAINHRWRVLLGSLVLLAGGGLIGSQLKTDFSRKTFLTFPTSTCGFRKTRRFRPPTKPPGVRRKWCAR